MLGRRTDDAPPWTDLLTDESQLRDVLGWPSARAVNKQIDRRELPSCAAILRDHAALGEGDLDELPRALDPRAAARLPACEG
jgi:hypothetical protein